MSLEDIRNERLKKLALLKEQGINPYPATSRRTTTISNLLEGFDGKVDGASVTIAGRVMSIREHGGTIFCDLYDGTGKIQGYLKEDELGEHFASFGHTVDIGDFIDLSGTPTKTKRGENSVLASSWTMLSKSLRTLPEKWVGITDPEERLRRRYLDILSNEEARRIVEKRSVFWNSMRTFFLSRGYTEVETPVLETVTGGAEARPFVTHHNALDIDVFLRISAGELWQKKLMVAGIPKTFEIGRIFRNEGMSAEHLQDYTQMESYEAYADFETGMQLVQDLYRTVAQETFGTTTFTIGEFSVDLNGEWPKLHFCELIEKEYGIDPRTVSEKEAIALYKKTHPKMPVPETKERAVDGLWKNIRKTIGGPAFLIGVPVYLEPLAKRSRDDDATVERFQVILAGSEMGKGFSELNDPIDQRERFLHQQSLRDRGDEEAQMADLEYVEAMEYGMPPTFGFGVSERLFSFLMNLSVREGQIFPLMRPR
ncbi:MAG: lysine--tRNA ligase [Candidatus Campbellbacteria bacterium]